MGGSVPSPSPARPRRENDIDEYKYTYSKDVLRQAWIMRQKGFYTMREIAEKFGLNREILISDLEHWLAERDEAKARGEQ